jgi:hypothetical protein
MRQMISVRSGTPRLPAEAGMNRLYWDFTVAGPWDANPARSGRNGPRVVPGRYSVRLTSGTWTATKPLEVIDPRIARDGVSIADLKEQFDHNVKARDMVTEVNQFAMQIEEGGADCHPPPPPPTRSRRWRHCGRRLSLRRSVTPSRSCRRTSNTSIA